MLVDSRDRHQHISYVARIISYHMRPPHSPPRYIRSPNHYTELGTRVSAGFFSPTGQRLASLALGGRPASVAVPVGVELSLVADGSFTRPLGMAAGSAV